MGSVAAVFGWVAVMLSLHTVGEAGKQAAEAREQTKAVIKALERQAIMLERAAKVSRIAAQLHYLTNQQLRGELNKQLEELAKEDAR